MRLYSSARLGKIHSHIIRSSLRYVVQVWVRVTQPSKNWVRGGIHSR